MYTRTLIPVLERLAAGFPVVQLTGPRQSGKTTLARQVFPHLPYVSLEDWDVRLQAHEDPRGFLTRYRDGAILDEVQHAPQLCSYLQTHVDESPRPGRYVLTGSQNFAFSNPAQQSLAGRIGVATLLPLSASELPGTFSWPERILLGGYPGLHTRKLLPADFYPSYLSTYIEHDVRQMKHIGNFLLFQKFLKLCAGRAGQLLNFSHLARDCGITLATARQWIDLLVATYLVFLVPPFFENFNKRVIKMPKLYFYDTGLLCHLLGIHHLGHLELHPLRGPLFENAVLLECLKERVGRNFPPGLFFWRDQKGYEVDLLAQWGGRLYAAELKSGATFQPEFIQNVHYFCGLAPHAQPYLVYGGKMEGAYQGVPWVPADRLNALFFGPEGIGNQI